VEENRRRLPSHRCTVNTNSPLIVAINLLQKVLLCQNGKTVLHSWFYAKAEFMSIINETDDKLFETALRKS